MTATARPQNGAKWDRQQRLADGQACLRAALDVYLPRGLSVLALCPPDHFGMSEKHKAKCASPGKAPWHKWKELQSGAAAEDVIRGWWRDHPDSNVGVALGEASSVVRVDVDGPAAEAKLAELSGGDLPDTWEFFSREDSRGLLYSVPHGANLKTTPHKQDGEHCELRLQANGAQTVLPPSRHPSGVLYRWRPGHGPEEIALAPAPAWLLKALRPDKPRPKKKATKAAGRPCWRGTARATGDAEGDTDPVELALSALAGLSKARAVAYDNWLHVGMALHSVSSGEILLGAWDGWSRACREKYQEGACREKWGTFTPGGGITLGTLLYWALEDGWKFPPKPKADGRASAKASAPAPPGAQGGDDVGTDSDAQTVYGITLAYYREAYRPTCRRGREVWSDKAGAWISARDVLQGAPKELLERLAGATDAPLMRDGRTVDRDRLPAAWRKWAPSAWVDMLGSTDPEGEESEVSASAGADLSRVLAAALHTVVTMGRRVTVKGVEETQLEQRSLADWCGVLAKPGRGWYRMRSWHVWARREDRLRIALRPDLFTQLRRGDLPQLTLRQLNQLAQAHEIGGPVSVAGNSIRAMELRGEWIAEYLALPPSALGAAEWDPPQDGRTEEHSKGGCYAERLERPAAT